MDNNNRFIHKDETHEIIGCAMEVLNEVGHGFHEKPYENALVVEFSKRNIACDQQPHYPIIYKDVEVGEFIPDLIAYGKIIVET